MAAFKSRCRPRMPQMLNRYQPGPLPIGVPLETQEPKTMVLPCISAGCKAQVAVAPSHYRQAVRFGMPWAECAECRAESDLLDGWKNKESAE